MTSAALTAGQVELPHELARVQAHTLPVPGTRGGQFDLPAALGGGSVRFERSADRWSFFSTADIDRATLKLRWDAAGLPVREQQCRLRRTGLQMAGVGVDLQPARLLCEGACARLELQARPGAGRASRTGSLTSGNSELHALEIRSVLSIQGTPLAPDEPVGYVLLAEGRPMAALDLLGVRPVLREADGTCAQCQAAVVVGLVLALSWEPSR